MIWIMTGDGGFHLGACGVVSAPDEPTARERMVKAMREAGCSKQVFELVKLKPNTAVVTNSGDY